VLLYVIKLVYTYYPQYLVQGTEVLECNFSLFLSTPTPTSYNAVCSVGEVAIIGSLLVYVIAHTLHSCIYSKPLVLNCYSLHSTLNTFDTILTTITRLAGCPLLRTGLNLSVLGVCGEALGSDTGELCRATNVATPQFPYPNYRSRQFCS
jgi:hypothetical protein